MDRTASNRSESPPVAEASGAYAAFKRVKFFASLDGLRAISILGVIWYHTMPWGHETFLGQGNKGVTLFFAISGFLIVTLILRAKEGAGTFSLPRFWGRRMLRIFPVYYAVLAAYCLLVWKLEKDGVARETFFNNLPAFATFTANWFVNLDNARVIFYFAWSLAAEEQFYVVWPFIERFVRGRWPLVVAVAVLVITQAVGFLAGDLARTHLSLRIITSVPAAIVLGVMLAHLLHHPETYARIWRFAGQRGSAATAALIAVGALALGPQLGEATGDLVISASLALLVATCVVREDNDLAVMLRWRPMVWVGTVSYGMYLLHMIAVNLMRRAGAAAGLEPSPYFDFVAGSMAALALATISYLTYEKFFLRLKDRWFGNEKATVAKPVVPAAGLVGAAP
jgi:peptidoglycan/LPS O-acetylase OafA/YrhL